MSWLQANLDALQHSHPEAAILLKATTSAERGAWTPSRAGPLTLRRDGVAWASAFDPVAEARRNVPDIRSEVDLVVLTGLGAGYLAEAIVERYPDLPLLIAEEDASWWVEVLTQRDLRALWSRRYVVPVVGVRVDEALRPLAFAQVELLHPRPVVNPEWAGAIAHQVANAQARARVNLATYVRFADLWLRNLRRNEARANVRPLSVLEGWANGLPAVIAAAGPSLAERFDWMHRHRRCFVLIAVDTAWAALAAQGLVPDLLLVLDGQYWNARHVDQNPPPATLVVTEWTGPPRAFELAPERTFVAASSLPFLRSRERERWGALGSLPTGGSVATAAWSLALHLGCSDVAFAGMDLGYPRGQTHVPGSQFEEAVHRRSGRLGPAETLGLALRGQQGLQHRPALDGGTVLSDPRMDLFRDWLAAAVRERPDVRAVNLGTRGSLIPGLARAEASYGASWKPILLPPVSNGPSLSPRRVAKEPPFDALRAALTLEPVVLDEAWSVAREFWGSAWDSWADRARRTWELWPSPRSRRALEEVLLTALDWKKFWTDA